MSPDPGAPEHTRVTFCVTTRSRLRSVRFFPSMLRASLRIRRQLDRTPGCIRFANMVMGPREFWTLTVWRTRQEMLDFMRSGEHEDIMWEFSRWLESFWLMRWRPTVDERGAWKGMQLAQRAALPRPAPDRTPQQQAALDAAFDALPRLRAAASPSGAASIDYAPGQRRARKLVAGGIGGTLRVEVPSIARSMRTWFQMKALRSSLLENEDVLRCAFGVSRPNELYLLAVFRHEDAWEQFEISSTVEALRKRYPEGVWTMRWDADNEFGHWDGFRLRRVKTGSKVKIKVPEVAHAVSITPEERRAEKKSQREEKPTAKSR